MEIHIRPTLDGMGKFFYITIYILNIHQYNSWCFDKFLGVKKIGNMGGEGLVLTDITLLDGKN